MQIFTFLKEISRENTQKEEVYVTVERKQRGIGKQRKHTEKIKQGILKIKRVKETNI